MQVVLTWLRMELRKRWRSLLALALLVALAVGTVLAAAAGARRGQTTLDRLWAQTLPATATVLPNQPGFDWAKVRALPEVTALTGFPVTYGFSVRGYPGANGGLQADNQFLHAIERPVMLQGRIFDPRRVDEVLITPKFESISGLGVGDTLTIELPSVQQANNRYEGTGGPPRGPRILARIVGVGRNLWGSVTIDGPGQGGGVLASPALFTRYRANIMGTNGQAYINALVRLKGGAAAIPELRADLARITSRSDIDVWDNAAYFGDPIRKVTGYEAACVLAFAIAALLAALFLVGQSVARYTSAGMADLRVLQALGMTRWQAVVAAAAAPFVAAIAGTSVGVIAAIVVSQWTPTGAAGVVEPNPGISADWAVLGPGLAIGPLLVLAGAGVTALTALGTNRHGSGIRRSAVAAISARAGLPASVGLGVRFALEPGRGRYAVPVRPAVAGAIAGVLGVLAAFTFAAGVSDAAANPARFGQTWQLATFLGINGQDLGPAGQVLRAAAADRDVVGVNDTRIGGAQSGRVSIESYTYAPVAGSRPTVAVTAGRLPTARNEIALAPATAGELHAGVGSVIRLTAGPVARVERVTGIAFVPVGPHNGYADGSWLTPAGFSWLFAGAQYAFKFHAATVQLRPGASVSAVARRLNAAAARITGGRAIGFGPPEHLAAVDEIRDLQVLPVALSVFLAMLALGAMAHALFSAVTRRRHELAVLRALGMTPRQARTVVMIQASVLAVLGLTFGVPLGLILGRNLWRAVASFTPLAYHPPLAIWALLLIGPITLLAANMLSAWPQRHAARLRTGQVLRTE
jgi:hypothetical protein